MRSPRTFIFANHQNKGRAFVDALKANGWHESHYIKGQASFGLFDADWRSADIDRLNGRPYFLYPHAARPMVQYDGCVTPRTDCRAMFVSAPAGVALMQAIGYPCEVVEVGWSLTPIRDFKPAPDVKKVLFAPIHPNANGWLSKVDKDLNRKTYDVLSAYCRETGAALSVRMIGTPEANGLESADPAVVHQGRKDTSFTDMANADIIVAHQTFAYMAIALGKPCVMFGEDVPPRSGNSDESFCYVSHWDSYKADLMYPLDVLKGDAAAVIGRAAAGCRQVLAWRERFIGRPFDGGAFVRAIEERL